MHVPDMNGETHVISPGSEVTVADTALTIIDITPIAGGHEYLFAWEAPFAADSDCDRLRLARYIDLDAQRVLGEPACFQEEDDALIVYTQLITCDAHHSERPYDSPADICERKALGEPCTSGDECTSGTCNERCVELQERGGSCDETRICASGQCFNGRCFAIATIGESCDEQTLCQESGCDVSTHTCVPFLPSDIDLPFTNTQDLYSLSEPGQPFVPLSDRFAWINVYEAGTFSFSASIYNGVITQRTREPLPHPTHVMYLHDGGSTTIHAVTLRALITAYSLLTAPVQPALTTIAITTDALDTAFPNPILVLARIPAISE